jgi:hypothetical protein
VVRGWCGVGGCAVGRVHGECGVVCVGERV